MLLYKLGRLLQFLGLLLLPVAVAGEIAMRLTLMQELLLAGGGVLIFTCGWLLQQVGKPE